jgi:hypothetical protein
MSIWERLTAIALVGQFVVIAVGTLLAYLQLRGLRHQREAGLIQHIFEKFNEDEFAKALDFVYSELQKRLTEPAYLREIAEGRATSSSHRELVVAHFFNELGLLVHTRMVRESPVVPFVASPCMRAWERLAPVIELMRRRYPHAYTPFESLVVRSRALDLSAINPRFRAETQRLGCEWERTARELVERRIRVLDGRSGGEPAI